MLAEPVPGELAKRWENVASPLLLQLLWNRGCLSEETTQQELTSLLSPDFERDLHDPLLLPGMAEATARILRAVDAGERITVYGDYDADGIPGTALLLDALTQLGARADYLIPERELDGYGLSAGPLDRLVERGTQLIVTVDCGIRSREAVRYARERGIDVIVTDHHQPGEDDTPEGIVVHPALPGSKYPNPYLSGAGVAYKLVTALALERPEKFPPGYLKWALDLVAISTVADLVPLRGENRVLVHFGLIVLAKARRAGLRTLYGVAEIDPSLITPRVIGFGIAPRLNAPGRLTTADASLELLLAEDEGTVRERALALHRANGERQELTRQVYDEAEAQVQEQGPAKIYILSGGWPAGVVGIVASRLMNRYHRPFVLIGGEGEIRKGSARSVPGLNITELFEAVSEHLVASGGHARAAGLTVRSEKIDALRRALTKLAGERLADQDLEREETLDAELSVDQIDLELYREVSRLEPYGMDNHEPLFLVRGEVSELKKVGQDGQHLKLRLRGAGGSVAGIGFGLGHAPIETGDEVEGVARLRENLWQGRSSVELFLEAIRPSSGEMISRE